MRDKLTFEFPACVDFVVCVREAVRCLCLRVGFPERETSVIMTAAWEAVLNAVTHGSPYGDRDRVQVELLVEDGVFQMDVTSPNPDFVLPTGKESHNPSNRRGRGLPIILAFMDRVWLTKDITGTTLHMRRNVPSDNASDNKETSPGSLEKAVQ